MHSQVYNSQNIRYRAAELEAIRRYSARLIVIRMKNATGPDNAELLVKGKRRISRFAAKTPPPFVAGIDASGTVKGYEIV